MKKVVVMVMFMVFVAGNAWASKACMFQAEVAKSVMTSRQAGVPITVAIKSAEAMGAPKELKEFFKIVINIAYKRPLYNSQEMKQQAITEFSNEVYLVCERN